MYYKTYQPSEVLSPFVKCYWVLESPKEDIPEKQRIVPDGCMEMIFHYGDLYRQYLDANTSIVQPRCFVFGQITSELEIEQIIRLQSTLKMMLNNQFTSLTALAHEGSYYDQAHFIKDFKELTGVSPKEFYSDNLKMSSLFYGTE